MTHKVVAKLDKKGSEQGVYWHYTFGVPKSDVNGGFYVKKDIEFPPDFIEIEVATRRED